jgi:hypothetical protein
LFKKIKINFSLKTYLADVAGMQASSDSNIHDTQHNSIQHKDTEYNYKKPTLSIINTLNGTKLLE